MKIELVHMDHESPGFWPAMGPFFASRELAKELGGSLYSTETMRWLVARDETGVVGWFGIEAEQPGRLVFDWSWVRPERRGAGVYRALESVALGLDPEATIYRATCRDWMAERFIRQGFEERKPRGAWRYFWRQP